MRNKIDLLHVYAGTRGAMGLYMDEIYNALSRNYSQEVVVSHYYPFNYGKKWFYKYTDVSSLNLLFLRKDHIRLLFKFLELFYTLFRTYLFVLFNKVKFINYGLTSDLYIEYLFLKILKLTTKTKIIVTCHDVVPFGTDNTSLLEKKIKTKKAFFHIADFLLIHNDNSRTDLDRFYKIDESKVFMIPFPIMDLNKLEIEHKEVNINFDQKKFTVGMFGYLRAEKGVDVLIESWLDFYKPSKGVELIISGYVPSNINYDFDKLENKSVIISNKFVDDTEFKSIIQSCDVVILPYKRGTNSGIPSSIISCDTLLITSDIPMFKNNGVISDKFLFESENSNDLVSKLNWLFGLDDERILQLKQDNKELLEKVQNSFCEKTLIEFDVLFKLK